MHQPFIHCVILSPKTVLWQFQAVNSLSLGIRSSKFMIGSIDWPTIPFHLSLGRNVCLLSLVSPSLAELSLKVCLAVILHYCGFHVVILLSCSL